MFAVQYVQFSIAKIPSIYNYDYFYSEKFNDPQELLLIKNNNVVDK